MSSTLRIVDPATGDYIVSFYNPRNKRRYFYLVSSSTGRFVKRLIEIYICNTCTFESNTDKDYTKTLYIESTVCTEVPTEQLEDIVNPIELSSELDGISMEYPCQFCCEQFNVQCEIVGTEIRSEPEESECIYGRIKEGHVVGKKRLD